MSNFSILDSVEQGLAPSHVGIQEFSESSSYCDLMLYPGQTTLLKLIFLEEMTGPEEDQLTYWMNGGRGGNEIRISPNIRERRDFLRENGYKHFREVQLIGGRRSSKGFVTGLAMAYVMYATVQLGDPGEYYGIDKEKMIYFSCVAGSESQAKEFQYADFVSRIETCKAFEPYLVKSLETEFRVATHADLRKASSAASRSGKMQRDIARLRGKALAANAGTLRGSATMVITIDEAAHMIPGESKASLDQVYGAAEPSLDQFGIDGMLFLNSSPYTKVGMFYECFEANMRPFDPTAPVSFTSVMDMDTDEIAVQNGNPRNMALQYSSWHLFEGYRYYKSRWKQKERGRAFGKMVTVSPDWNPEEVDEEGRECFSVEDKGAILQARAKEASNPETYKVERRGKFAEVTDAYLNPSMVDRMYQGRPGELMTDPMTGDITRQYIPYNTNHGQDAVNLFRYKFHLDPSSTTAGFGFAIGHIEYFPNVTTGVDEEHLVMDLVKRWDPAKMQGKVIQWGPILNEISTYAEIFRPFEITFDQHNCLAHDTLISTIDGLIPISELANLQVGEGSPINIPVHTLEGPHTATYLYRRGPSPTRILTTKNGYPIEATLEHRLWVRKNRAKPWHPQNQFRWITVDQIEVGDYVAIKKDTRYTVQNEIPIDHYWRLGSGKSQYKGVSFNDECHSPWVATASKHNRQLTIGRFDTEQKASEAYLTWMQSNKPDKKGIRYPMYLNGDIGFLMGAIAAEGDVYRDSISFGNSDRYYLDVFKECAERTLGGNWSYQYEYRETTTPQGKIVGGMWGSHRCGGYISKMFYDFGCDGNSYTKKIPSVIFRSPEHVVIEFLRAYFEGDGCAVNSRYNDEIVMANTMSGELAKGVQQLLLSIGIYSTLWYGRAGDGYEWRVKMFGLDILEFANKVGFVSPRKQSRLLSIVDQINQRNNVGLRSKLNREGDLQYFRVTKIEDSMSDTYDLSVPGPESFCANGVISHNSAEPIQRLQEKLNARNVQCRVYERFATGELNWKRAEVFKTALYQGLIHAPYDEEPNASPMGSGTFTSKDELKFLQQTTSAGKYPKVDKQSIGPVQTKDMADSIMEVCYALLGNLFITSMRDRLASSSVYGGAPGGYAIGGGGRNYPQGGAGPHGISELYSRRDERMARDGMTRSNLTRSAIGGRGRGRGRPGISPRVGRGR